MESDDIDVDAAIDGLQELIDADDLYELSDMLGIEEDQCLPLALFFIRALESFEDVVALIGRLDQQ